MNRTLNKWAVSHSKTPAAPAPPIASVVLQHAEEIAGLRVQRTAIVRAPHLRLPDLRDLDERLAAHLDGLAVARDFGTDCCIGPALDDAMADTMFAAVAHAVGLRDEAALNRLITGTPRSASALRGAVSGMAWMPARYMVGIVQTLLASDDPFRRLIGLGACRLHSVNPGPALSAGLQADHVPLRAQALLTAGSLGRVDLLDAVRVALEDTEMAYEAARSLCLLGEPEPAWPLLQAHALDGPTDCRDTRWIALTLLMLSLPFDDAKDFVRFIGQSSQTDPTRQRLTIRAAGLHGGMAWVPWLIQQMRAGSPHPRVAGEAFSMITGADLSALERARPPSDDPWGSYDDDEDATLDEDDGLPWPDAERVQAWWEANAGRLPVAGRCFVGAAPSVAHCLQVLRTAPQRQRVTAAYHLCFLRPGRPLFNCAAPAWRQERLLTSMA